MQSAKYFNECERESETTTHPQPSFTRSLAHTHKNNTKKV